MPSAYAPLHCAVVKVERLGGSGNLSVIATNGGGTVAVFTPTPLDIANVGDSQNLADWIASSINGTEGWEGCASWYLDAEEYVFLVVKMAASATVIQFNWNQNVSIAPI